MSDRAKQIFWFTGLLFAFIIYGWGCYHFAFICDDAYIAFRYVRNLVEGYGLTWNRPPFVPVEGYTSFLWVVLLAGVWQITGHDPTQSCHILLFLCGLGTLVIAARIYLRESGDRLHTSGLVLFIFLFCVTNRTFLAWSTSGLETGLFTLLLLLWVDAMTRLRLTSLGDWSKVVFVSNMLALCRPDGYLYCAVVGVLFTAVAWRQFTVKQYLLALRPAVIGLLHLGWRLQTYGMVLPNTYYAKHVGAWPDSGRRYLISFLIEYGYFPLGLGVFLLSLLSRRTATDRGRVARVRLPAAVGVTTAVVHLLYYTFNVGGDHFEYRIYMPYVVLIGIGVAIVLRREIKHPGWRGAAAATALLVTLPLQWTHYARTYHIPGRNYRMYQPIADAYPSLMRPYVAVLDRYQKWLIYHSVGMRVTEHQSFIRYQQNKYLQPDASVALGSGMTFVTGTIGWPGWLYPDVAILDSKGLVDRVVAFTPVRHRNEKRQMAHDRGPPEGYHACLGTTTALKHGILQPVAAPVAESRIVTCEREYWAKIRSQSNQRGFF